LKGWVRVASRRTSVIVARLFTAARATTPSSVGVGAAAARVERTVRPKVSIENFMLAEILVDFNVVLSVNLNLRSLALSSE
jgi:hypothetical protein